ncbi:MAG: hypothetical protein ACTHV5_01910 [Candidatus Corynebacterium faecigallinarum]
MQLRDTDGDGVWDQETEVTTHNQAPEMPDADFNDLSGDADSSTDMV